MRPFFLPGNSSISFRCDKVSYIIVYVDRSSGNSWCLSPWRVQFVSPVRSLGLFSFLPSCGNFVGMLSCCACLSPTPLLRCMSIIICLTSHSHMEQMFDVVSSLRSRQHVQRHPFAHTARLSSCQRFVRVPLLWIYTMALLSRSSTPASRGTCITVRPTRRLFSLKARHAPTQVVTLYRDMDWGSLLLCRAQGMAVSAPAGTSHAHTCRAFPRLIA